MSSVSQNCTPSRVTYQPVGGRKKCPFNRWGATPFATRPAVTAESTVMMGLTMANVTAMKEFSIFRSPVVLARKLTKLLSDENAAKTTLARSTLANLSSDGLEPPAPPKTKYAI